MTLEEYAAQLLVRCGNKALVAISLGYIPAHISAEIYDTYGLHPIEQDMWGHGQNPPLRVDLRGFVWEMAKRGADVRGMLQELTETRKFYESNNRRPPRWQKKPKALDF